MLLKDVLLTKFKNGYDILINYLVYESVEYLFGVPGGSIMHVYDTLHLYSDRIFHILSRHEQGSIHAAQGYARVSKKVGVCMSTSGPGTTNLITGLADSFIDSTPVLCLCGQVTSSLLGKNSFQEINIIEISISVTKWSAQILLAQDIGISLQKAFSLAIYERKSTVLIDITKDAQYKNSKSEDALYKVELFKIDRYCLSYANNQASSIEKMNEIIKSSKKPFVLVGKGITWAKAEKELKKLIELADFPLGSTILGLDVIKSAHPLFIGMIGMHGGYAINLLINQCDLLIAIGLRFDDRITGNINRYARKAKVIHIDLDTSEISKQIYCHQSIVGDCKQFLQLITEKLRKTTKKVWIDIFYMIKKCEEKIIIRDIYTENVSHVISMGEVIKYINIYKDKDAILITDVGQNQMVSSRYLFFVDRNIKVTSGGNGTMGFSLPAAIGCQFGYKERQVVCIVGDGGLQMTLQEFGTIFENKLPIKIILLNNGFLGMVRQWQELFFDKRYAFTRLINPYFNKVAKSYEIESKTFLDRIMFVKEVKETLENTNAFFLEVFVKKEENVFPMFSLGEAVDEVRVN